MTLRISPQHWRHTILSSLGVIPVLAGSLIACSGQASDDVDDTMSPVGGGNIAGGNSTESTAGRTSVPGVAAGGAGTGVTGTGTAGTGTVIAQGGATTMTPMCSGAVGIAREFLCDGAGAAAPSSGAADLAAPAPSSLETCSNGIVHRVQAIECTSVLPRPGNVAEALVPSPPDGPDAGFTGDCLEDSDCTEKPHGYCTPGLQIVLSAFCNYGCVNDSECDAGHVCDCGDPVGRCVPADCTTDSDCACDAKCQRVEWDDGCGPSVRYQCQSPDDECASTADCDASMAPMLCASAGAQTQCTQGPTCVIGRPFLVAGCDRQAPVASRSDWLYEGSVPKVDALTLSQRQALAEYWQSVGQMEHASIAAFARFALELLGQGAPAELIEATQRALADETAHAKLAFSFASTYAGKAIGPAKLNLAGAAPTESLEHLVRTAIQEGCVGETIAAMEAAEALARATDPAVRAALAKIVEDESAHARLAWSFVRWALAQEPSLAHSVAAEFAEIQDEASCASEAEEAADTMLTAHGLLPRSVRAEVRREALRAVVRPCAEEMLHGGDRMEQAYAA